MLLRPVATGPGAPEAAYSAAYEREEQRQDARDRQDGSQPLLRGGLLGAALRALRQRNAGELIYEADPKGATNDRQDQRHHQGQERHQEAVFQARAGRHPARGVAPDKEGQEQRDQEPNKGGGATLREALAPRAAEDRAHYPADDAAKDEARPESSQPAEHDAHPARAPVRVGRRVGGGAVLCLPVPARLLDPART